MKKIAKSDLITTFVIIAILAIATIGIIALADVNVSAAGNNTNNTNTSGGSTGTTCPKCNKSNWGTTYSNYTDSNGELKHVRSCLTSGCDGKIGHTAADYDDDEDKDGICDYPGCTMSVSSGSGSGGSTWTTCPGNHSWSEFYYPERDLNGHKGYCDFCKQAGKGEYRNDGGHDDSVNPNGICDSCGYCIGSHKGWTDNSNGSRTCTNDLCGTVCSHTGQTGSSCSVCGKTLSSSSQGTTCSKCNKSNWGTTYSNYTDSNGELKHVRSCLTSGCDGIIGHTAADYDDDNDKDGICDYPGCTMAVSSGSSGGDDCIHNFVDGACTKCEKPCPCDTKEMDNDNTNHWEICSECGKKLSGNEEHNIQHTSIDQRYHRYGCTKCDYTPGSLSGLERHDFNSTTAICSECNQECYHNGETGTTCSNCGYSLSSGSGSTHTHSYTCSGTGMNHIATCSCGKDTLTVNELQENVAAESATCTDSGKSAYTICKLCKTVITPWTVIPAVGHNITSATDNKDGTHTGTCTKCKQPVQEDCNFGTGNKCTKCGATKNTTCDHDYKIDKEEATQTQHWEKCTKCGDKTNTDKHNFVNGVCTVCEYQCKHTYEDKKDETYHWKECTNCKNVTDKAEHDFDEDGECDCGEKEDTEEEPCKHPNTPIDKKDEEEHWKECPDCGEEIPGTRKPHDFGDDGECGCGEKEDTEEEPCKHPNTPIDKKDEKQHWKECPDCGEEIPGTRKTHDFGDDGECDCGEKEKTEPEPCKHIVTKPHNDETHHWNTCQKCGEVLNKEEHKYENGICSCGTKCTHKNIIIKKDSKEHWQACEDCGAEIPGTREPHNYDKGDCACGAKKENKDCTHPNKEWKRDKNEHWQVCKDCGNEISGTRGTHNFTDGKCKDCGSNTDGTTSGKDIPNTGSNAVVIVSSVVLVALAAGVVGIRKYKEI